MKYKLWIFLTLFIVNIAFIEADENFSVYIELKNDTLDSSNIIDDNSSPYPGDLNKYYHFRTTAIITNESTSSKSISIYRNCKARNFELESNAIHDFNGACLHTDSKEIILEPNETYDMPIRLSFRKDYTGDTLKFRIRHIDSINRKNSKNLYWSEPVTIKIIRDKNMINKSNVKVSSKEKK